MKTILRNFLFIFIACLLFTACSVQTDFEILAEEMSKFPEISYSELVQSIGDDEVVLIDVNGSKSYKEGHIPDAIDFESSKNKLQNILPDDRKKLIICYCASPECPAWLKAAKAISLLGYINVRHYADGISGWEKNGGFFEEG